MPDAQLAKQGPLASSSGLDSTSMDGVWESVAAKLGSGPAGQAMLKALQVAFLVSPFFFWGTSMPAMKSVMHHTTPMAMGAFRLLPAGLLLVAWASAHGRRQPSTPTAWAWVAAFGLVDAAAFQGFLAQGLVHTSAGLGSVIIDSQPLSVAVMAAVLFGETLSGAAIAGLLVGVVGLALLNVPGGSLQEAAAALSSGVWSAALPSSPAALAESGEFWMLLAAQSMAVGTIMVRYVTKHVDPVMATGWHMVLGGAVLAVIASSEGFGTGPADSALAAVDTLSSLPAAGVAAAAAAAAVSSSSVSGAEGGLLAALAHFTPADLASMAYVSLLGGAASYGIFFYNASHGSLTALSSLTFLTPVFASAAGYVWLDEVLTPMQLAGAGVTLSAVTLLNQKPNARTSKVVGSAASGSAGSNTAQNAGQSRISNDRTQS